MQFSNVQHKAKQWPTQLWWGILLIAIFWPVNWLWEGSLMVTPLPDSFPRTFYFFFPLWLGYVFVVDGLVYLRRNTSLYTRSKRAFLAMFLVSAMSWWLFEVLNWRTENWVYLGREDIGTAAYLLFSSLSFSTVLPAVIGTAELASTFGWIKRLSPGPAIKPTPQTLRLFFASGLAMLLLMLAWPAYFFPFMWLSLYFMLAPTAVWLGARSLSQYTQNGDWRPVVALWIGGLICGFFWEFWNYFAYAKWIYEITPSLEFAYIFEMPLLGYGGYLPFALELFCMYHVAIWLLSKRPLYQQYIQFDGYAS